MLANLVPTVLLVFVLAGCAAPLALPPREQAVPYTVRVHCGGLLLEELYDTNGNQEDGAEVLKFYRISSEGAVYLGYAQFAPGKGGNYVRGEITGKVYPTMQDFVQEYPTPCSLLGPPASSPGPKTQVRGEPESPRADLEKWI